MRALQDLRYAFRSLRQAPGFTAAAALTLMLGIGATTGLFTLLDQIVLRKLPVEAPDELVALRWEGSWIGSNNGFSSWSYPWYEDLRDRNEVFSELLCRDSMSVSLGLEQEAERITAELVSGNYFRALGLQPAAGRLITEDDDSGEQPVAVLTHTFWQNNFGGRPNAVGEEISLGGRSMTIIGVAPEGFHGVVLGETPEIFVPVSLKLALAAGWERTYDLENRRNRWLHVIGRLKPGVSIEQAKAGLEPLFEALKEFDLEQAEMAEVGDYGREQYRKAQLQVLPGAQGISSTREEARAPLWTLTGMVSLLLLIGCVNVANLMMARAEARRKEIAVRLALGAGRGRIIGQLMAESLLLAVIGGVPAIFLASWTAELLVRLIDDPSITATISTDPNPRMLAAAAGVTILTAILFGLTPALRAVRVRVASTLKDQAGAIAGGNVGLRKGLVTAQIALSLVLLIGAGLMWRTLSALSAVDSGYQTERVVVFGIDPPRSGLDQDQSRQALRELQARIAGVPGVEDAGYSLVRVMANQRWDSTVDIVGYEEQPGENVNAWVNAVSPGYFATLGVPIVEGRDFRETDRNGPSVMIVNQAFAEYFFKGESAIGHRMQGNGDETIEIVGVVPDVRYGDLRDEIPRQMFFHYDQFPMTLEANVHVRTAGAPEALLPTIRGLVREVAPDMPIYGMRTMDAQVETTLTTERMLATLGAAFGGLAALLSGIGLFGVLAFAMARRTKEIGLRMALGAQGGDIAWLALREAVTLFAIGALIAIPASLGLARLVESQLYGTSPYDPATVAGAAGLLAVVSLLAAMGPARRAARTEPMKALRFE